MLDFHLFFVFHLVENPFLFPFSLFLPLSTVLAAGKMQRFPVSDCVHHRHRRSEQTVALDHYGDLVDSMMSKFVAINSGVEMTVRWTGKTREIEVSSRIADKHSSNISQVYVVRRFRRALATRSNSNSNRARPRQAGPSHGGKRKTRQMSRSCLARVHPSHSYAMRVSSSTYRIDPCGLRCVGISVYQ